MWQPGILQMLLPSFFNQ